ncbi:MAG: mCpol domain-containing protein [Pseudonocardiaceae bacterium]
MRFAKVHVIHTRQSHTTFVSPDTEVYLPKTGVSQNDMVHHVVDLGNEPDRRLGDILSGVTDVAREHLPSEFYFDLTGGLTQVKVALGILAYLLGTPHVYTLETPPPLTLEQRRWDLDQLRDAGVSVNYRQVAGLEQFDLFGLSNLTSVRRVRAELVGLQNALGISLSKRGIEIDHLISLLEQAERARLKQEERSLLKTPRVPQDERTATRSILFHATAAAEAVVDLVLGEDSTDKLSGPATLGPKLRRLRETADARSPHAIDTDTLTHLTELLLRLRNRAAHQTDVKSEVQSLELQGDLGLRLSKSFIWLMATSLESFLDDTDGLVQIQAVDPALLCGGVWYVGMDGDETGRYIASSLRDTSDCEHEIRSRSGRITRAINRIKKLVHNECGSESVLFASGDNILFRGCISIDFIAELLNVYSRTTQLTASVGLGRTPYQASIALSLAKGEGGGTMKIVTLTGENLNSERDLR